MHSEQLGSKTEQCKLKYTDMRRKMVRGFTGALVVAGISLYVAKRVIDNRRRIDLEAYRSLQKSGSKDVQGNTDTSS